MSLHVVVCDDEPHVARMISCRLMRANFEVHTVHDFDAAWEVIERVQPQLLITDLQFPALELVCRVRSLPTTFDLPVIALTSIDGNAATLESLRQELNLFAILPKPFSPRQLIRLATAATRVPAELASVG